MSDVATVGLSASMTPQLIKPHMQRPAKVRQFRIPGLGRLGVTRDIGGADLFNTEFLRTRLRAIVTDPAGRLVEEHELGSGKITNIGVLALANDFAWAQVSGSPVNTLGAAKFHAWGTSETAEAKTDFELGAYAKPTAATENAVEGTNSLVFEKAGKNQKLKSEATITATESLKITEWGLHTSKVIKPATQTATATSGTSITGTGTPFTASTATIRGEQNNVVWAEKAAAAIGLITASTTSVLTIPGWIKAGSEAEGATPEATTKFRIIPTLLDHRVFAVINVAAENKITFPWELEIVAGG
jgi:hypothetical protein